MNNIPSLPADAVVIVGLSPPVMSLAAWLIHEKFPIRHLHVVSSTQGLLALKEFAERTGLPACEQVFWHGEEVDGTDGEPSQIQFQRIVGGLLDNRALNIPLHMVLGGGVNWMISIASQLAAFSLRESAGDGLWVLKTAPAFEHHPGYSKPGAQARVFGPDARLIEGPSHESYLQRVLLVGATRSGATQNLESVAFNDHAILFMGQSVRLPPLQLAFYRWLLSQTKFACCRPQLGNCDSCYACALPAKHLSVLSDDFRAFYARSSHKPGYVKSIDALDFPQRVAEYVSKINTNIRRQANLALYRQLKIGHGEGGYLPGVDKNYLKGA
ncbi:MAG: hypothetical protein Q8O38_05200 [Sulfurimicrobium sp.]|nr:hypothetical protein [Sulfurimicrobium sp.]